MPAFPNCAERAMVKHPACAAAINSSGLVPFAFSKRVENEYGVLESTPLSLDIVPFPSLSDPFHTAEALRTMNSLLLCVGSVRHSLDVSRNHLARIASPFAYPFYSIVPSTRTLHPRRGRIFRWPTAVAGVWKPRSTRKRQWYSRIGEVANMRTRVLALIAFALTL